MNANAVHRLRPMLFAGGENGNYENLLPEQILFGTERVTRVQWKRGHSFEMVLLNYQKTEQGVIICLFYFFQNNNRNVQLKKKLQLSVRRRFLNVFKNM